MSETVRVVVDAMGGDNAPGEIVKVPWKQFRQKMISKYFW